MKPWRKSLLCDQEYNGLSCHIPLCVPHCRHLSKMNRVVFLFVVGVCFAVGQALNCYKCDIGFGSLCLTSQTTCSAGQQCFNGVGKAAGFLEIKMKGCLDVAKCNQIENVNFPSSSSNSTIYSMNKTCCSTDLCNAAPGLPGTSVLSLAFAAISALIVTNVLV